MPSQIEARRVLTSVRGPRSRRLPWALRRHLVAAEIRRRSPDRLDARLRAIPYAQPAILDQVREAPPHRGPAESGPIWQFWAGAERPPIVVRAMESVAAHAAGRTVVVLDADSYREWVTLPAHLANLADVAGWTHFSDVLRVFLLREHGGTWIDATVRLSAPIPDEIGVLDLFAFTRPEDPFLLSTWFLRARAGEPLVSAVAEMLDTYWREHAELVDYFLLHFLVEAAVTADADLRRLWMDVPVRDFRPPHWLQDLLAEPFDAALFSEIAAQTWVHKLTHKLPAITQGSFGQWLSDN